MNDEQREETSRFCCPKRRRRNILDCMRELEIVSVTEDEQLRQAMDIRRRVYCDELAWLTPETMVDEWDSRAEHFLASLRGRTVATARTLRAESSVLEIEKYIDLDDYRAAGECAEVSRLCALSEVRFSPVAIAMMRAFFRYATANNVRFAFITAAQHYRRMYTDIGFRYIGGPFQLLNTNNFHDAYVVDLVKAVEDWAERRPRMLEMFLQPIEGIG